MDHIVKLSKVEMREGQTIQCCVCLKMKPEVWADLNGEAFKAYYCAGCKPVKANDYRVTCTNCGDVQEYKNRADFDAARCNACGSLAFGLRRYEWIELSTAHIPSAP